MSDMTVLFKDEIKKYDTDIHQDFNEIVIKKDYEDDDLFGKIEHIPKQGKFKFLKKEEGEESFVKNYEFKSNAFSIRSQHDISRIDPYNEQPACVSDFSKITSNCTKTVIVTDFYGDFSSTDLSKKLFFKANTLLRFKDATRIIL